MFGGFSVGRETKLHRMMEKEKIKSFSKPVRYQRIEWIDALRGILIILMVYGHNIQFGSGEAVYRNQLYFENLVFQFIYSFHMPCLMIISGYLLSCSIEKKRFWRRKLKSLLVPILIWSIIPIGIDFMRAVVKKNVRGKSIFISALTTLISYYWFLWAILFCTVVIWVIYKFFDDNAMLKVAIGIIFMLLPELLNVRLWLFSYPYFTVGYIWGGRKNLCINKFEQRKSIIALVLLSAFLVLFQFYNRESFIYTTGISVRSVSQLQIVLYRLCIGFVGSATITLIVYNIWRNENVRHHWLSRLLIFIGRNSILIYLVDSLINSYILIHLSKGYGINYIIAVVETVFILAIWEQMRIVL